MWKTFVMWICGFGLVGVLVGLFSSWLGGGWEDQESREEKLEGL
jgi:hypothetical protein